MAKQPTNLDIIKRLDGVGEAMKDLSMRLTTLEVWKISTEASTQAVENYKLKERMQKEESTKMAVLKSLAQLIIVLTALAYAIINLVRH